MKHRILYMLVLFMISFSGLISASEEYWEYTFRPGDSIWKIANKYTTSVKNWSEIQRINNIKLGPDRRIQPGTRIVIPVSMLKVKPTPATVIAVNGEARLTRANGESEVIKIGTLLYSGDSVTTVSEQSLRIQFADYSELQVLADTQIVLDKLSHHKQNGMVDTRVRLNLGSVKTWVEKQKANSHYELRTPAALTAVRGTAFRLSSDKHQISRVEVSEGLVAVSAGGVEKAVKEGFGLIAEKDKPLLDPVMLLPAPILSGNQAVGQQQLKISWQELDGAVSYRYQLATDDKFNQITIDNTTVENKLEITDLVPARYFLRVRGVDKINLEGEDAEKVFEILQFIVRDESLRKAVIPMGTLLIIQ